MACCDLYTMLKLLNVILSLEQIIILVFFFFVEIK